MNKVPVADRPCLVEGCTAPRAVTKSGRVYYRCLTHQREYVPSPLKDRQPLNERPCSVKDCDEPRVVSKFGKTYPWCRVHRNEVRAVFNRDYRNQNPGFSTRHSRLSRERHPERKKAGDHRYYEANKEKAIAYSKAWHDARPGSIAEAGRRFRERHPERVEDQRRKRRETPFVYHRMDPWPSECQHCGEPIDHGRKHGHFRHDPLAESLGHEPPLAWAARHPEYTGPYVLRPEHWACNAHKRARPDWELT